MRERHTTNTTIATIASTPNEPPTAAPTISGVLSVEARGAEADAGDIVVVIVLVGVGAVEEEEIVVASVDDD